MTARTARGYASICLALLSAACVQQADRVVYLTADASPADARAEPDVDSSLDVDAGPDAGPDAPAPMMIRTVESGHLFGALDLDNAVLDPGFSTWNQTGDWLTVELGEEGDRVYSYAERARPPRTPTDTPALHVKRDERTPPTSTYGRVLVGRAPRNVSIWFGRAVDQGPLPPTKISVLGFDAESGQTGSSAPLIDSGKEVRADGIVWRRWTGVVAGMIGYARLVVHDEHPADHWIVGPSVTMQPGSARALAAAPPRPGSATDEERRALGVAHKEAERRRRWHSLPPDFTTRWLR